MGTRNLTAVVVDGEYKIAQYGQWDGYPEGQGVIVLHFLQRSNLDKFKEKCRAAQWITDEELKARWDECGADGRDWVNSFVSNKFNKTYPHLSRNCGAKVLAIVRDAPKGIKLGNNIDFASDSLFCEWAYVIDLDKRTFEVFRGFNKKKLNKKSRFSNAKRIINPNGTASEYEPIRLVKSYPLYDLPKKKEFIKEIKELVYPDDE